MYLSKWNYILCTVLLQHMGIELKYVLNNLFCGKRWVIQWQVGSGTQAEKGGTRKSWFKKL